MVKKWIDIDNYIGPNRRARGGKRLLDRRRFDETTEPPALHAMLRRLRVLLSNTADAAAHGRTLQLFAACVTTATELGKARCAEALRHGEHAFRDGDFENAEKLALEAMSYVG